MDDRRCSIDLNEWYARCDDVDRPDYFHFDLDPGPGAPFSQVLEAALLVRDALHALGLPSYPKTSGSKGIHVYRVAKRPSGRVLVDYNQNAWGRTLASVYSVRPTRAASVSTPLTWKEVEEGVEPEQFTMDVVLGRVARDGDLFAPVLGGKLRLPLMN